MKTKSIKTTINGQAVEGEVHLQPDVNEWIGIFTVPDHLLEGNPSHWKSSVVEYEGPFNARGEQTAGRGKARITYVSPAPEKDRWHIRVEGIGKCELENKAVEANVHFRYNVNLTPGKGES